MLRQPWFWVVVILLIMLLFGANKLPGLAGSVGQSLKIFKKEVRELQDDTDVNLDGQDSDVPGMSNYQSPPQSTPNSTAESPQHSSDPPK